jgi:hypothetical protein
MEVPYFGVLADVMIRGRWLPLRARVQERFPTGMTTVPQQGGGSLDMFSYRISM